MAIDAPRSPAPASQAATGVTLAQLTTDAPIALAIFDREMRYLAWSGVWSSYYGLQGRDLLGQCHYDIFPDMPEGWRQAHRRGLAGETVSCAEESYMQASGSPQWIRWYVWPLHASDGSVKGIAIHTEDITDRKDAETALRKGAEKLRQITSTLGIGIFEHEFDTGRTEVSDGYLSLVGIARADMPRSIEEWMDLLRPTDPAAYRAARDKALDPAGDGNFTFETHPVVNGQERAMLVQSHVSFQGEGADARPERLIGLLIDQSESRKLQQALSRAQRLETVGRMAGIVAHDFNNILTVILGNLELAMARTGDAGMQALLRNAVEAAEMGAGFNKRLLTLAGGRRTAKADLALDDHLCRTWEVLRRVLSDEIVLRFEPGAPDAMVFADPTEIDGALLNLVVNARDAQPGGGQIVIRTGVAELGAAAASGMEGGRPGRFLRLSVSDQGGGMTEEVARHAFEPFFTTKAEAGGTGLGLTSVAMAAQRADGFLNIRTAPGSGTEISIYLPLLAGTPTHADPDEAPMPFGDGQLVLVVEDDPMVRETTMQRLEAIGYAVIEAGNVDQALAMLHAGEPADLVFSDVVMPGRRSGYDLMREVHQHFPAIPVLLTSGHVSAAFRRADLDRSVEILAKPYPLRTLAEAVAGALNPVRTPGAPHR